ncbi:hypothetical protein GIW70_13130 [Pseudomonas syringae]|nr:hypothetical protein [Pseudomonas syringae]MCF5069129.1 hypothetical protein [Pseudomonas syringae]
MINWNGQFTQLIRQSKPGAWGNWTLSSEVSPGAVGILDPLTGTFKLIADTVPGLSADNFIKTTVSSDWDTMSSEVSRTETEIDLGGEVTDPETGVSAKAGMDITWKFGREGSMVSKCALDLESVLNNPDTVLANHLDWLVQRATQSGMGSDSGIAQGFGIITSVLYARSGLNVGSMSSDNAFSLKGNASAVQKMVGEVKGKGSYSSASSSKSVDKHLWPSESGVLAAGSAPLAYTFASFDGRLVLPSWVRYINAFQLIISNANGGTYIVDATLAYDTPRGRKTAEGTASGGLTVSFSDIPLDASNVVLECGFRGVMSTEKHLLQWKSPRGQWIGGVRHVDLYGVWPGSTRAVDVEAGTA